MRTAAVAGLSVLALAALAACGHGDAGAPTSGQPETITEVEWRLVAIQWADGHVTRPADPSGYILELGPEGRVRGQADCNRLMGTYALDASRLEFGPLATTRMACPPGSLAPDWLRALGSASTWLVRDGHLHVALADDAGTIELASTAVDSR